MYAFDVLFFFQKKKYIATVWSEGFLYNVAPPELKISPIMYFVIHNSVVLSQILKIIVPLKQNFKNSIYMKLIILIIINIDKQGQNGTTIFNILDKTTELWMTKYIIGKIFSSVGATLYKNPSDQTVALSSYSHKFFLQFGSSGFIYVFLLKYSVKFS